MKPVRRKTTLATILISICFLSSGLVAKTPPAAETPRPPEAIKFIAATPEQQKKSPPGMVYVPAGDFMMGCDEAMDGCNDSEDKPYHKVYLDAYYMDKFEVTVQQFVACVKAGKCSNSDAGDQEMAESLGCNWAIKGRENHPANCVDWHQADAYCKWAGKRLPTEAEWEKAARGTDGRKYPWGNQEISCDYAVFAADVAPGSSSESTCTQGCGKCSTWPVGGKPAGASPYGAMDMAGNVTEWVADLYDKNRPDYNGSPNRNPTGPEYGQNRICRGGGQGSYPRDMYSWNRYIGGNVDTGFRCALGTTQPATPPPPAQPKKPAIQFKPGEMVTVPAGEFIMGSTSEQAEAALDQCEKYSGESCDRREFENEQPQHKVYLDEFQIDRYEVTIGQYLACVKAGKCLKPEDVRECNWLENRPDNDRYPMTCVDWNEAEAFCKWDGKGLPTEAEWEKAARGTDGRIYPWGNETANCNYAVMLENGDLGCARESRIWPVGSKPAGASPYGAMDMAGNVSEWVADWYDKEYYSSSPNRNPTGPAKGRMRATRGGDWSEWPSHLRTAMRGGTEPFNRYTMIGFRCARGKNQTAAASQPPPPQPPAQQVHPGEMVLVPAGKFKMGFDSGASDEIPAHMVYLDAFHIDRYEVTVREYSACVQAGKCSNPEHDKYGNWGVSGREDHPINCVGWNQADAFCKWAGKRLPTEAEWEKAARGEDERLYPWGNQAPICDYAVIARDRESKCGPGLTLPIGSKPKGLSPYGAMDMAGNVIEWVADWYNENYYKSSPSSNPKGPSSGQYRVLRGGSWADDDGDLRATRRTGGAPEGGGPMDGFRCAKNK